jgi:LPXTG-motif cell wall-anchored protein
VRSSVRRVTRIAIVGAIAAFAAVPLFAASASAVEAGPGGVCTFNVVPDVISPPFPAPVHIDGTAPSGATVTAYNGATPLVSALVDGNGHFTSADFGVNPDTQVSANFAVGDSSYASGCGDPEGVVVVRVAGATAAAQQQQQQQQQQQALAFTGSNNTTSFVLIGVTALIVGVVLTVGARRRNRISS